LAPSAMDPSDLVPRKKSEEERRREMSAESLGGGAGDGVRPGRAMPGEGAGGSKNRTMGAGKERRWKV
jgi:hypothetical protein